MDQIGKADRHGKRTVLGQVEVLAGHRRDDDPQRLRQDHQAQDHPAAETQRIGRLGLPVGDGEDAAAHDLGDEGSGIGDEADQQGHEFRRHLRAADEVEPAHHRPVERDPPPPEEPADRAQAEDEAEARPQDGDLAARLGLPLVRPGRQHERADNPGHRACQQQHPGIVGGGNGEPHAPVRQEYVRHRLQRLPGARQRLQEDHVPEEELEQQRGVPHHLDIDRGELPDQPVLRQPGDADHGAEHGRDDHADRRHIQGVDDADEQRPGIGVGRRVVDQRFADREGRFLVHEIEAGREAQPGQVVQRIVDEVPDAGRYPGQGQHLVGDRAEIAIVPG